MASGWVDQTADYADERGFTRPIGAEQGKNLAALNGEINVG
jgi:hypothetical protein